VSAVFRYGKIKGTFLYFNLMQKQINFRILYLIYRETFVKIKESINIFQTHLKCCSKPFDL